MALFGTRKGLCQVITVCQQTQRFRGKINIRKPKPPHFEKAKYLELTKPWFVNPNKDKLPIELCKKLNVRKQEEEDNQFQKIIARELKQRIIESRLLAFCHLNSMTVEQRYNAYVHFHKEGMFMKQYGKQTLKLAVENTPYETILDFFVSQNMMVFSPEPKIKQLLKITKKFSSLVLLAGVYEGKLVSKDELLEYSQIPSLQAAQAGLVQILNNVGSNLVSQLNTHQTTLVSHLEERAKQLKQS